MDAIKRMTLGEVVDYCIDYNDRADKAEKQSQKKDKKRKATQSDIDLFFG